MWVKSQLVNQSKRFESAFADEVLAEIARQRGLTAKEVQQRAGITSSTWGNYFRERSTRIPLGVMVAVSDVLGVLPEEMMRRARLRAEQVAAPADPEAIAAHALSQLSPQAQANIARASADLRPQRPPTAPGRAAGQ